MSPLRIGLTGGIGSGKSTTARWWQAQGACVVDTDSIAHHLTGPGGSALPALLAALGPAHVDLAQGLNRPALRDHILTHPEARRTLEAILHPLIAEQAARQAVGPCVVFDVPLLVESSRWRPLVDRVLVMDCTEATQVRRAAARPGWSVAQVEHIIQLQASRARRRAAADASLDNSEDDLPRLHLQLRELALHWGWDVKESRA